MKPPTVWQLPAKSQEFDEGPKIRQDPGERFIISYDFELDSGAYAWEELVFIGTVAFRFTESRHCSEDQVGAYDRLQDLGRSDWFRELRQPPADVHHYRIYFDDIGCYEVLAAAFVPPADNGT
jgi:hypothetical protein